MIAFLSVLVGLTLLAAPSPTEKPSAARSQLHALFDEAWEFELREDPLFATSVGDHRFDDRLPSVSVADQVRRARFDRSTSPGFPTRAAETGFPSTRGTSSRERPCSGRPKRRFAGCLRETGSSRPASDEHR